MQETIRNDAEKRDFVFMGVLGSSRSTVCVLGILIR